MLSANRSITMDESAVFGHVIDELETRDYQPLVHVPGSHQDTYADVLGRCETHQITIGGRYPDVLGFTHADRVFAVEVKGSSGLLRGIGQALTDPFNKFLPGYVASY